MATWKKVIVSGSDAELRTLFTSAHITSSINISASGFLYGNLPVNENLDYVVVYNDTDSTHRGRLERKVLNLVTTRAAPSLFLLDQVEDSTYQDFKLSHDTGSSQISGITPYYVLSASNSGPAGPYDILPSNNLQWLGLNTQWDQEVDNDGNLNTTFYGIDNGNSVNITGSVSGSRNGLISGSTKLNLNFSLNAVDGNNNAVPTFDPTAQNEWYNYLARSFNDGGIGELRVFFNDNVTPVQTVDLTNYDSITDIDNIGSGQIVTTLSPTRSNLATATGDPDPTKHARSGSYHITGIAQRDGYNFTYVIHTGSKDGEEFSYITNFVEWFYDTDGAGYPLEIKNQGLLGNPTFDLQDTSSVSGIKFFNADAADGVVLKYGMEIESMYRNIYPSEGGIEFNDITGDTVLNIEVRQNGTYQVVTVDDQNVFTSDASDHEFDLAPLQNVANAHTSTTTVTASLTLSFDLQGTQFYQPSEFLDNFTTDAIENSDNYISFAPTASHVPGHKTVDKVYLDKVTLRDYMLRTLTPDANKYEFEDFKGEQYRLISKSYAPTETASIGTYAWDSEENVVNGTLGHQKGAIQYYSHLLYPNKAGVNGVFDVELGPTGSGVQPTNYNTATGEREYYRYFEITQAQEGSEVVNIELLGKGKIVADTHTTHFGNGDNDAIKLYIWRSGGGANSFFTGEFINVMDNNIYQGNFFDQPQSQWIPLSNTTVSYSFTNVLGSPPQSFRTGVARVADAANSNVIAANEYLIIKIVAPQNWTGYINAMAIQFTSNITEPILTTTYTGLDL